MKDLILIANECMANLDNIGIEYGNVVKWKVNTRAKSRWGQCSKKGNEYTIEITNELLKDDVSDKATKDTIYHELLHTVKGCMNHGKKWQDLADLVNDCYMMNIKRTTSSEEKGVQLKTDEYYKYKFKCSNCGCVVRKSRQSKFTKRYTEYGCGHCGMWHTFVAI